MLASFARAEPDAARALHARPSARWVRLLWAPLPPLPAAPAKPGAKAGAQAAKAAKGDAKAPAQPVKAAAKAVRKGEGRR
jgi:cell division protein FtsW